jgi:hypothetical protein
MRIKENLMIILSLLIISTPTLAGTLRYDETSEGKTVRLNWKTKKLSKNNTEYSLKNGNEIVKISGINGTEKWSKENKNTSLTVKRKDNKLFIKGTKNGEKIDKIVSIGNEKWMASPGFFLKEFITSDKRTTFIWVLNMKEFSATKMVVNKQHDEQLKIAKKSVDTIKVEMKPTG